MAANVLFEQYERRVSWIDHNIWMKEGQIFR